MMMRNIGLDYIIKTCLIEKIIHLYVEFYDQKKFLYLIVEFQT